MLFHVYKDPKPEGYYVNEPSGIYRTILDADWPLYILLPILLVIVVALLMLAWRLHEIPKHKAEHKNMRQIELVSALTLLGLMEHWVWAIALFIAFMDWDAFENRIVDILRRSRMPQVPEDPGERGERGTETPESAVKASAEQAALVASAEQAALVASTEQAAREAPADNAAPQTVEAKA